MKSLQTDRWQTNGYQKSLLELSAKVSKREWYIPLRILFFLHPYSKHEKFVLWNSLKTRELIGSHPQMFWNFISINRRAINYESSTSKSNTCIKMKKKSTPQVVGVCKCSTLLYTSTLIVLHGMEKAWAQTTDIWIHFVHQW